MSSEETTSDADGEDTLLLKQPMPWRSDKVTTFFYDLDKHKETVKSSQSKRPRFVPVRTKCLLVLYLTKSGQLYVIHSSPLDLLPLTFERNSIDYLWHTHSVNMFSLNHHPLQIPCTVSFKVTLQKKLCFLFQDRFRIGHISCNKSWKLPSSGKSQVSCTWPAIG